MKPNAVMIVLIALVLGAPYFAGGAVSKTTITADDALPGEIVMKAFTLSQKTEITISGAWGLFTYKGKELISYSWIIRSDTRETVWEALEGPHDIRRGTFEFSRRLTLPEGGYEVFQTCQPWSMDAPRRKNIISTVGDWVGDLFRSASKESDARFSDKLKIVVSGNGALMQEADPQQLAGAFAATAPVRFTQAGDNASFRQTFALDQETRVRIYAIGEALDEEFYDYGALRASRGGDTIWTMTQAASEPAGGSSKNVRIRKTIVLQPGTYEALYVSDDSHHYNSWNAMPPHDPQHWGVLIFPENPEHASRFKIIERAMETEPAISILHLKERSSETRSFEVREPVSVRVMCLGESDGDELTDFGWIKRADTRQMVWDMRSQKTRHAGGAAKNRMAADTLKLDKGAYLLHYTTDRGHNYGDWNAAPPTDPHLYGISLWVTRETDRTQIVETDRDALESKNVLARIVRIRDDASETQSFSLSAPAAVQIIAVGEGFEDEEMSDGGWLTDRLTGRIVWKMTWENTSHAGGARKNRRAVQVIHLPKGEYLLHYKTDDSHAYGDWNQSPPDDPEMYGITVRLAR